MQKWSLNNHTIEVVQASSEKDLIVSLQEPIRNRQLFTHNDKKVIVPRYFLRIIGVEDKESSYYNYLYDLENTFKKYDTLYLRVSEGFEENINKELLRDLNVVWSKILLLSDVSGKVIVNTLEEEGLLLQFPNQYTSRQIKGNLQGLLEYYFELNFYQVDPNELKRLVFYLVSWSHIYVEKLLLNFDYVDINPKVLYYGDLSKEEVFFLIYLSSIGCDVLYFNPQREYLFGELDRGFSSKIEFNRKLTMQPFPKSKIVDRAATVAHGASEQIRDMLSGENNLYYRPWALMDHLTKSVTLKTTYEEIAMLIKENAMVRHQWEVSNDFVYIPNIFAKVYGTHKNKNQYWREVYELMEEKHTLNFKELPISNPSTRDYYQEYFQFIDNKGRMDEEKLLNWSKWPYLHLPTGLQRRLAHEICELCNRLEVTNKSIHQEETLKIKLLSKLLEIDDKFIKLVQKFDFPQEVPKIIIFNNEINGDLSFEDAIVLKLMNKLGLDIVIFNPTGHNDIENYIDKSFYDIHRLETVEFNLSFKEKSFLNRIFL